MKSIGTTGRILFGIPLIVFGIIHFMQSSTMAQAVLSGWPIARILVFISGFALILAGLSIIIKTYARLAMILLGVLMFIFVLALHVPGLIGAESQQATQMAMTALLKDMAIGGAAWFMASKLPKE